MIFWLRLFPALGERTEVRDATADAEPVSGHIVGRPSPSDPVLRSTQERIFLRSKQTELRCHPVLLPKWGSSPSPRQCASRRLRWRNQILRAGRVGHEQIQVGEINIVCNTVPRPSSAKYTTNHHLMIFWFAGRTKVLSRKRRSLFLITCSSGKYGCCSSTRRARSRLEWWPLFRCLWSSCQLLSFAWRHFPSLNTTRCTKWRTIQH